jgi:hypothetical protein
MGNWEQCSMIFTPATGYEGVFNLYFAGSNVEHSVKPNPSIACAPGNGSR